MKDLFEIAAGSVMGREHRLIGKNNQDAYYSIQTEQATVAIACDGCGSSDHSEVGAKLGARLTAEVLSQMLRQGDPLEPAFWEQVQQVLLAQLRPWITVLGGSFSQVVRDYFLFTVMGVVVTPMVTSVFSLGDGVAIINGQVLRIEPFPGNAPPYLAYNLLNVWLPFPPESLQFQIQRQLMTKQVESILIGTDGVNDLLKATNKPVPGQSELAGDISQFWQDDRYFDNPTQVHRRLTVLNRELSKPNWQQERLERMGGLLSDDTTLIVIRKARTNERC